jgi:hypothetical protein
MATRKEVQDILNYAKECKRECDETPTGILITLVALAEVCLDQQDEIDRLRAFAFGAR